MESTLSYQLVDYQAEVGFFLGFGRGTKYGDPAWTGAQQATIASCVNSGLRQFLFPPPAPGSDTSYDWSFLKPLANLTLAASAATLPLPSDFGGLEGQVMVLAGTGVVSWPIDVVGIGRVYAARAEQPGITGRPLLCCVEPLKGTSGNAGQQFQLTFFPTADQSYGVQFQYYVLVDAMSPAFPYAYGGAAHVETILESCLAVAEQRLDDASTVHSAKFAERLLASINIDRKNKPQKLGYNRDNSDSRGFRRGDGHWNNQVKIYGNVY
jgi:hypothetical protein